MNPIIQHCLIRLALLLVPTLLAIGWYNWLMPSSSANNPDPHAGMFDIYAIIILLAIIIFVFLLIMFFDIIQLHKAGSLELRDYSIGIFGFVLITAIGGLMIILS